jgi:CheY-like chemotaxis protein
MTTNQVLPERILIVDDEAEARELFKEIMLRHFDFIVETATNGKECIEKCSTLNYDLVLLDLFMPVMDGFETLKHFQNIADKKPQFVVISNMGGDLVIKQVIELGAHSYAAKAETDVAGLVEIVTNAVYNPAIRVV